MQPSPSLANDAIKAEIKTAIVKHNLCTFAL